MEHPTDSLKSWRLWLGTKEFENQDVVQLTKWLADCEELIAGFKEIRREVKRRIKEVA